MWLQRNESFIHAESIDSIDAYKKSFVNNYFISNNQKANTLFVCKFYVSICIFVHTAKRFDIGDNYIVLGFLPISFYL
jgi:hypothetical protein